MTQLTIPGIPTTAESMATWWEINQFYAAESALLDARQYEEWLALMHPELSYVVPIARNVRRDKLAQEYTRSGETCWFDEGHQTLSKRIAQLKTGMHWIEEPSSRFSRMVTNVQVHGYDASSQSADVESRFLVYQNRLDAEVSLFAGRRRDTLVREGASWLIKRREVYLAQSTLLSKALALFF